MSLNRTKMAAYAWVVGAARDVSQAADATEVGDDGPVSYDVPSTEMKALRRAIARFDEVFRLADEIDDGRRRSREG